MCVAKPSFRSGSPVSEWVLTYHNRIFEKETTVTVPEKEDFIGLYFNIGTEHRYTIDGLKSGSICKDQFNMMYVPIGGVTMQVPPGEYDAICIQFSIGYLSQFSKDFLMLKEFLRIAETRSAATPLSRVNLVAMPEILQALNEIRNNSHEFSDDAGQVKLQSRMMSILTQCLQHIHHQFKVTIPEADAGKITKAYDYLTKNISKQITVSWLADLVSMDVRKFEKAFKIIYGTTVYKYLVEIRLRKSFELLRETDLLTKEIALAVGYKETKKFSEAFKKKFGYSPSDVRKLGTNAPPNVNIL